MSTHFEHPHFSDPCTTAKDVMNAARQVQLFRNKSNGLRQDPPKYPTKLPSKPLEIPQSPPKYLEIPINYPKANEIEDDHPLMQLVFEATLDYPKRLFPTIKEIHKAVAHRWRISINDLISHRRVSEVVLPRQVLYVLCHLLTTKSYPEIGRRCGDRDHTTILHGVRKFNWLVDKLNQEMTNQHTLVDWVERCYELCEERHNELVRNNDRHKSRNACSIWNNFKGL